MKDQQKEHSVGVDVDGELANPPACAMPPHLRPFVSALYGYHGVGLTPGVHRGLPSDTVTLVLPLGGPLRTAIDETAWRAGRIHDHRVVLGGLHTTPAFVVQPQEWAGIQLALHPLGVRRLFGAPAAALPVGDWDATDLLGASLGVLLDRLHSATTWPARYAVVLDDLTARWRGSEAGGVSPILVAAWREIHACHGAVRVAEVADAVGVSRRRLSTLFGTETGVTPKTAARLMRFDTARKALSSRGSLISDVAVRCGYYDQAHLAADFREFTGLSPTAWLEAEAANFPNLQANPHAHAAESTS